METVLECSNIKWGEKEVHIGTCGLSEDGGCPFVGKVEGSWEDEDKKIAPFSPDNVRRRCRRTQVSAYMETRGQPRILQDW